MSLLRLAALALACVLLSAGPAFADTATRATLSWDTDDTDVDLHVWDADGNHAWYRDQDGIAGAELSTDITDGYGPENLEDFWAEDSRGFGYGLCYYASNREDGAVPDTVATVTLTDPDGSVRTIKRRLRAEGDAFLLGTSPANGDGYQDEDPGWCRGATTVRGTGDDGGVGQAGDGGGSAGSTFGVCDRVRRRIGVVEVCADTIADAGRGYTMTGDVRLDNGVAVGAPVTLDTDAKTVTTDAVAPVSVVRQGGPIAIAAGVVDVDASAKTDPVSGRGGLATMELSTPAAQGLTLAGLPASLSAVTDGKLKLFVDSRDGGGIVAAARLGLPLPLPVASLGDIAVGVHGSSRVAVRPLGGSVDLPELTFAPGWGTTKTSLAYAEGSDTWTVAGGLRTPFLGAELDGAIARGRLDALGIKVTRDVPIAQTGFILSSAGGRVEGLTSPPLRVSATASGRWGSVPSLKVGLIHLKQVKLTVGFDGKLAIDGQVGLLQPDGPVSGRLRLGATIAPFSASGSLDAGIRFQGVELNGEESVRMTTSHFTAGGGVGGSLRGVRISGGEAIVSDKGAGAFGEICIPSLTRGCWKKVTVGFGVDWSSFPSLPQWIGADIGRFATLSKADGTVVRVPRGRPLLFVDAVGGAEPPTLVLRSPSGRRYRTDRRLPRTVMVDRDAAQHYTGVTVASPEAGRWRVERLDGGATAVRAQSVRAVKRLRVATVRPKSSRKRPLRRSGRPVTVRWRSAGLGKVRVDAELVNAAGATPLRSGLRGRGSLRVKRSLLRPGRNRVRLTVLRNGIGVDARTSPVIWGR